MKLSVQSTVQEVFDQFNQQFPYLRLEFYKHEHHGNEGSKPTDQVSHQTKLSQLNPALAETTFSIDPSMTVSELEKMMRDNYHLNAQVFRKSADIWLQTTATDHWSLEKQNGKGHRSTSDYDIQPIDITDFDVE